MSDKPESIQLQLQVRNARQSGPTSSSSYNDTQAEIAADLTELNTQWNERIVPLTTQLPNGSEGLQAQSVDAFEDGLDGATVFVDSRATSINNGTYFNETAERPNTVLEQLEAVYSNLSTLSEQLEARLSEVLPTAEEVTIADEDNLFDASNVENALSEIRVQLNALDLSLEAIDLSALAQDILPSIDAVYDIGAADLRWANLYLSDTATIPTLNNTDLTTDNATINQETVTTSNVTTGNITSVVSTSIQTVDLHVTNDEVIDSDLSIGATLSVTGAATVSGLVTVNSLLVDVDAYVDENLTVSGQAYSIMTANYTPGATTQTIDWDLGNSQSLNLGSATGNVTLTFTNAKGGASYVLLVKQHASSAKDITWPVQVKWADGIVPVISTGASAEDIISFWYSGSFFYGSIGQSFS